jgi:hypothetical protein
MRSMSKKEWPDLKVKLRPGEKAYRMGTGKNQVIFLPERGQVVKRTGTVSVDAIDVAILLHLLNNPQGVPEAELDMLIAETQRKMKMN